MDIKDFIFKYVEKIILGMALCYFIYTTGHTFVTLSLETHRIDSKLLSQSNSVDRKLKTGKPPIVDTERKEAAQMELRFTVPPQVSSFQRAYIFGKFTKEEAVSGITTRDLLKKQELQFPGRLDVPIPGDTEFTFKGGTPDLALIQVRKLFKDTWWTESFTVETGKTIGQKMKLGRETVDFDTHCKLMEIIPSAQKPMVTKKTVVLRDEKGEFLGTSVAEETHTITTSRIVFENKQGAPYNLWIGELVNLGTETVTIHPTTSASSTN